MDLITRLGGVALIGLSLLAGKGLEHLMHSGLPHAPTAPEFLLAAMSFVLASMGAASLVCGAKLLERQPVARRWRRYD